MPAFTATAPAKIILFGEHAVVYGQPAIAVPVSKVQTRVMVSATPLAKPGEVRLQSPLVGLDTTLPQLDPAHPLAKTIAALLEHLKIARLPACSIRISSNIPVAAGMGSGAAVTVAMLRALSAFLGHPLADETVSALAFEVEKIHHGTPSGIDNTVITYRRGVYFVKGQPIQFLTTPRAFTILIADTGTPSPTSITVGEVRKAWQTEPARYENIFERIGQIVHQARKSIENGAIKPLGRLMDENHSQLQELGVSSPKLDQLVEVARRNGALGAKLSGGGRGGNLIALVESDQEELAASALREAGAVNVIATQVGI